MMPANDSTADIAAYLLIASFRYTSFFEMMLRGVSAEGHYDGKASPVGHNGFFLQKLESSRYNIIGTMAMAAADNPAGRALGIIGMGQVGFAAAKRAVILGMRIHYHGRKRKPEAIEDSLGGARFHAELKTMLEVVDCVLLACPYNAATHHILGKEAFSMMKRGMRVVNVGRGKCIDESALAVAIEDGIVAGAGLDVFYDE
jgi:lactate dehydrogenase-like 2-hydroxyacid dehydrogenase